MARRRRGPRVEVQRRTRAYARVTMHAHPHAEHTCGHGCAPIVAHPGLSGPPPISPVPCCAPSFVELPVGSVQVSGGWWGMWQATLFTHGTNQYVRRPHCPDSGYTHPRRHVDPLGMFGVAGAQLSHYVAPQCNMRTLRMGHCARVGHPSHHPPRPTHPPTHTHTPTPCHGGVSCAWHVVGEWWAFKYARRICRRAVGLRHFVCVTRSVCHPCVRSRMRWC